MSGFSNLPSWGGATLKLIKTISPCIGGGFDLRMIRFLIPEERRSHGQRGKHCDLGRRQHEE